jgi:transposase InsO family protein/DNA-binding transcriptional regulator YiaG
MRSFRPPQGSSPPAAFPALLRATHLLGLALGSSLGKLRDAGVTAARMFAKAEEQALLFRMMREAAEILGTRWDKVPERQRPHYAPEQRFRILRIRSFLGLSQCETAEMFRVSTETIARWEVEAGTDREVARPLIAPKLPVRRFADVVRAVVKTMELAGFGGNDLIARTLARAGWKLSARTVGRIRKGRWPVPRPPASSVPRAVRAKRPNHIWMADLTDVKGLFSLVTFKVGVVFDVFSRMPLSARVFTKEPSSAEIARFVSRTAKQRGQPAHFVSDRGACFTGGVFRRRLERLGVKQRFGAIGQKGSIALIERLWRTLKDALGLRLLRPMAAEDLMATIALGLVHYAHFRPHQAVGGATPAEIYFGRTPSHLSAIPPPRGRPGERPMDLPFLIDYLDAERLLPGLSSKRSLTGGHDHQRRALAWANPCALRARTAMSPLV